MTSPATPREPVTVAEFERLVITRPADACAAYARLVRRCDVWRDKAHSQRAALARLQAEAEALRNDAERYRQVRKWSPVTFTNAWQLNIQTGKPFDEIVDHLAPFTAARAALSGEAHE